MLDVRFWLYKIENVTVISIFFKAHIHLNSLKLNTHQNLKKGQGWGMVLWESTCLPCVFWGKKEGRGVEGKSLGFLFQT